MQDPAIQMQLVYSPNFHKNFDRKRIFSEHQQQGSATSRPPTHQFTRENTARTNQSQQIMQTQEKQLQWSPYKQSWAKKLGQKTEEKRQKEFQRKQSQSVYFPAISKKSSQALGSGNGSNIGGMDTPDYTGKRIMQHQQSLQQMPAENMMTISNIKIVKQQILTHEREREQNFNQKITGLVKDLKGKGCGSRDCKYTFFNGLAFAMHEDFSDFGKYETCGRVTQIGTIWFCNNCYARLPYQLKRRIKY